MTIIAVLIINDIFENNIFFWGSEVKMDMTQGGLL